MHGREGVDRDPTGVVMFEQPRQPDLDGRKSKRDKDAGGNSHADETYWLFVPVLGGALGALLWWWLLR